MKLTPEQIEKRIQTRIELANLHAQRNEGLITVDAYIIRYNELLGQLRNLSSQR